jgi:hypothetical protein
MGPLALLAPGVGCEPRADVRSQFVKPGWARRSGGSRSAGVTVSSRAGRENHRARVSVRSTRSPSGRTTPAGRHNGGGAGSSFRPTPHHRVPVSVRSTRSPSGRTTPAGRHDGGGARSTLRPTPHLGRAEVLVFGVVGLLALLVWTLPVIDGALALLAGSSIQDVRRRHQMSHRHHRRPHGTNGVLLAMLSLTAAAASAVWPVAATLGVLAFALLAVTLGVVPSKPHESSRPGG